MGAILTTIGGEDQITLLRHLDPDLVRQHPKRFLGYSDNTNLLNWLWFHGVAGFHGGWTQVHLGPGPSIHPDHLASLRAALYGGEAGRHAGGDVLEDEVLWDSPRPLSEPSTRQPAPS